MRKVLLLAAATIATVGVVNAEFKPLDAATEGRIAVVLNENLPANLGIGKVAVDSAMIDVENSKLKLDMNAAYGYVPELAGYNATVKSKVAMMFDKPYSVEVTVGGVPVERLYSDAGYSYVRKSEKAPFVYALDKTRHPKKGLDGKVIAMWQSHGFYFEPKLNRWEWQRARIFQTVEDLYTQSFVMPYLMPMLENAGAYVMSPRERDTRRAELIVDNNGGFAAGAYAESNGTEAWTDGGAGFAYKTKTYKDFENPFRDGTFRKVASTKGKNASTASWSADIPEAGSYAVYVSYATLPESTEKAVYTVHTAGGDKQFQVNQRMGGGTWIYLGHFDLAAGSHTVVTLTSNTGKTGEVVTADAVKIGGGMGNIERRIADNLTEEQVSDLSAVTMIDRLAHNYQLSGYPRFTEGARYWLQWAGVPDSVYSPSHGVNDYNDDYRCRGLWVNYLAGGSSVIPGKAGLNIPVDLSFAFHSDAGTTKNDDIIGTLGIYCTKGDKYANGTDRMNSRQLTDMVMSNICSDVRAQFDSKWIRRGMWDASYYEARVPEVPAMLLELLSHQNFADMRYGLDPTFRFTVSRAIYKGMAQFFAAKEGRSDYMIQPLPVNSFAIAKVKKGEYRLTWKETVDTLCNRAQAQSYIVSERIGDGAFRQIAVVKKPEYVVKISDNAIHSYRIVAANDGGVSFPSEILALGEADGSKGEVLVVNGFTRVCAPDSFVASPDVAGFASAKDHGVPYMSDINTIGDMYEFRRDIPWYDDDSAGFGASRADQEDKVIAGNTFDYPAIHGAALMESGYSFVSASVAAVENGIVDMKQYKLADLILGKQKETQIGRGEVPNRFLAFTAPLQKAIADYTANGGSILVSGSYVATDIWDKTNPDEASKEFAKQTLGYQWRVGQATIEGKAHTVPTYFDSFGDLNVEYYTTLNDKFYAVESPDGIYPADKTKGCTLMRYGENNIPAAVVADQGGYRTCVMGFPFETIKDAASRRALMGQIMEFFNKK